MGDWKKAISYTLWSLCVKQLIGGPPKSISNLMKLCRVI